MTLAVVAAFAATRPTVACRSRMVVVAGSTRAAVESM
jgi:hypothetical protein